MHDFKMGLMIKKPEEAAGAAWPAIVIGLFVAFGGVLFGMRFYRRLDKFKHVLMGVIRL